MERECAKEVSETDRQKKKKWGVAGREREKKRERGRER